MFDPIMLRITLSNSAQVSGHVSFVTMILFHTDSVVHEQNDDGSTIGVVLMLNVAVDEQRERQRGLTRIC